MGTAQHGSLSRSREILQTRIRGKSSQFLAAGPGRCCGQVEKRSHGGRCGMRIWSIDYDYGRSFSKVEIRRLRLPQTLHRLRTENGLSKPSVRQSQLRTSEGARLSEEGFRSSHILRLSTRYGRPRGRRKTRPTVTKARRDLDDRRALCQREARGKLQSSRPRVLQRVHHDLHTCVQGSRGRTRSRRPGQRLSTAPGNNVRRLQDIPQSNRDTVQQSIRSKTLGRAPQRLRQVQSLWEDSSQRETLSIRYRSSQT